PQSRAVTSQWTTQKTRQLPALDPASAPLDERTPAWGLVFASKFSRLVNYFNRRDQLDGDWSAFFDSQPLVRYACIAHEDIEARSDTFRRLVDELATPTDGGPENARRRLA